MSSPAHYSRILLTSIGPVSQIIQDTSSLISSVIIQAGEFLRVTPKLLLLDEGGNIALLDSTSRIKISLDSNPSKAVLSPLASCTATAAVGLVTFSVLRINRIGQNFRFKYVLSTFSTTNQTYTETDVVSYSEYFDVLLGPPRVIALATRADQAVAGGRGFRVQPVLVLQDYGSNIITTDSTSVMLCGMVQSLSAASGGIQVNTSSSHVKNKVNRVTVNQFNGTYGKGQHILFTVHFAYDIFYLGSISPNPYLKLTALTASGAHTTASLVGPFSGVSSLSFLYAVEQGDHSNDLNYAGTNSFKLNQTRYGFTDGNGRTVSVTLPGTALSNYKLVIDTTAPVALSLTSRTANGVYSAGQFIQFQVLFNFPVQVTGVPYLLLTAVSANITNNTYPHAKAYFSAFGTANDSKTLLFTYIVRTNDYTVTGVNLTVFETAIQVPTATRIQRICSTPFTGTDANLDLALLPALFLKTHSILIDRVRPAIDVNYGIRTNHSNGVYYPGENVFITARFDRPVVAVGVSINLYLQTGSPQDPLNGIALLLNVLDDDVTLLFMYTVVAGTNTTKLDIINGSALFVAGSGTYIRRKSTTPTLDADVSTSAVYVSGNSLAQLSNIQLYGFQPVVTGVSIVHVNQSYPGHILYPDDAVTIRLTYSTRVITTCSPVLLVDAGTYLREANFIAGNGTQYLDFLYVVETGDMSTGIRLSYTDPPPLCTTSGCSTFPRYCGIFASSTLSYLAAYLALPYPEGNRATGISIINGDYSTLPKSPSRNTSVVYVTSRLNSGSYGPGTLIYIDVTFNDVIIMYAEPYPTLYLNVGKFATYASGLSTSTISFLYITQIDDNSSALYPMNLPNTSSPIRCLLSERCRLTNAINSYVNTSSTLDIIAFPVISLDNTTAKITSIYTDLKTSIYEGFYTVGQVINIYVVFSRNVIVVGSPTRLQMGVGYMRYALYVPHLSDSTRLVFQLTVENGDESNSLAYIGSNIDLYFGSSSIYRTSDIPISIANTTLPSGSGVVAIGGNIIRVNTSSANLPRIISVYSVSTDTVYRTGDTLMLCIQYSHFVVLTGHAYVTLNLGVHVGRARYIGTTQPTQPYTSHTVTPSLPSNHTILLYFSYTVQLDDFSYDLDYTDNFAFNPGLTDLGLLGSVLLSLNAPSDIVSVTLPVPGFSGSLSSTSNIRVDGSVGRMSGLSFMSPPGIYSTGQNIYIRMNFTVPVIVKGTPYIILSTGYEESRTSNATYLSGSSTSSIVFVYTPAPGDHSLALEYRGMQGQLNSAINSFQLNGGSIMVKSALPSVPAVVVFSPPFGVLSGSISVTSEKGVFAYTDLGIDTYGLDYYLSFSTAPYKRTLVITDTLFVSFSSQFEVYPSGAFNGDRVCHSTAASGTVAVCGSPNSNYSVTSIQSVSLSLHGLEPMQEIQIFSLTINPRPAIQQFHTSTGIGEIVEGYFTVMFGDLGPSFQIPVNADEAMMGALLMGSIPSMGNLTISREDYIYCACYNAFKWTVTFNDYSLGPLPFITLDPSGLVGESSELIGPEILQHPAALGGSFAFQIVTASGIQSSSYIPYDASESDVVSALSELSLAATVQIGLPDSAGTRLWTLTFGVYQGSYEIPPLSLLTSHLTGGVVGAWIEVVRKGLLGPDGITGGFALEWRGNTTYVMPHNVSALEMKIALESLPVIRSVEVTRNTYGSQGQYIWIIDFIAVNRYSLGRYEIQSTSNVEAIIAHGYFDNNETTLTVYTGTTPLQPVHAFRTERLGSTGTNAGSAYVYTQLPTGKWRQINLLRGSDTAAGDMFGYSVALKGKSLLVGAIAGTNNGVPAIQSVFCSADKGHFYLSFRGWETGPLGVNITMAQLTAAIQSDPTVFSHLYSITSISIADWGGGGLCQNNTAVITFYTPNNGDYPFFGVDNGPAIELLSVTLDALQYSNNASGVVIVKEVQAATRVVDTLLADVQQQGVAYLFHDTTFCTTSNSSTCLAGYQWTEVHKFVPEKAVGGERFGSAIALETNLCIISAPGSNNESGVVYVFSYGTVSNVTSWRTLQILSPLISISGDNFGSSVAVLGTTLIVGALHGTGNTGAVYAFRSVKLGRAYGIEQILTPTSSYVLQVGDMYGRSVALSGDLVVVGAPGVSDRTIYLGSTPSDVSVLDSGAVFVFQRISSGYKYTPLQKLVAANVRSLDQFGWSVDIKGSVIIASGVQNEQSDVSVRTSISKETSIRSMVHVFQRNANSYGSIFTEQLYMTPYIYQSSDLCGYSVTLFEDSYAMVGCPQRDGVVPHTDHGSVIFFNLTLLDIQFSDYNYNVTEGNNVTLSISRDYSSLDHTYVKNVMLYMRTLDRNAPESAQLFAQHIYGIIESDIVYPDTPLDTTGLTGKAVGRSQYYGSIHNESSWISGKYDYRGISDYVPFNQALVLLKDKTFLSVNLITNADGILEVPNESVTIILTTPGLWPSILGRFITKVAILDNSDGIVDDVLQFAKIYDTPSSPGLEFGHAVAVVSALNILFSTTPLATVGDCIQCGSAALYSHASGLWVKIAQFVSPYPTPGSSFGDDIAAVYNARQNLSLMVIGEPGNNSVHVFLSQYSGLGSVYTLEATLTMPPPILPQHRFGSKGTIALSGSLLAVGSPGREAVYIFLRIYFNSTSTSTSRGGWGWSAGVQLRSSEFDYNFINSIVTLHAMNFGASVAVSGRTVVIGAPYADYGRLGSSLVEVDVDTQGQDIVGYSRGKVYVFSSAPAVQLIALDSIQPLSRGQFRLSYTSYGSTQLSAPINYNTSAAQMTSILESLSNLCTVAVTFAQDIPILTGFRTTWTVTFTDMFQQPPLFSPTWYSFGCTDCISFDSESIIPSHQVRVSSIAVEQDFKEDQILHASDARNGNRFGWAVAIDGHQLVVGAITSAAATTTTWDFEAGILRGWTASGKAFTHQPTYGDNSKYRVVKRVSLSTSKGSKGESSRMRGLYYIGTYELRPGNSSDYTGASNLYGPGSFQGDIPQGTLTSDVFIIYGTTISFLIGGGCDYYLVYVELLIDGQSVSKVTGKCEERMRMATFDVTYVQLRAAQIRIVDASSAEWGHINVDEIKFNWDVSGAMMNDSVYLSAYNGKDTAGGMIETPHSGAAYTYLRHLTDSDDSCQLNLTLCTWSQESKLYASDKRENDLFGSSVAVNDAAGVVVIGSVNAALTGYYREVLPVYPYQDPELSFPINSNYAPLFQGTELISPESSGTYGISYLQQSKNISYSTLGYEQAGAVYVYVKTKAVLTSTGSVAVPQHWPSTETTKLQPPDAYARDYFGTSISLDGSSLAVGAVGQDGIAFDAGAVYVFNMHFAAASFSRVI